jgi:threonine dehydratase
VSGIISGLRANVVEVQHSRAFTEKFGDTTLLLTLETRGLEHVEEILGALRERGYRVDQV